MHIRRRQFLKGALGATTLLAFNSAVPGFLQRSAAASAKHAGRNTVLVVIQLSGGNDGLNTVVPYEDEAYLRHRPTLHLPAGQVHKIGAGLGLHPEMPGFARLFHEGHLTIVQGVGYPQSNRDHDEAKRDWDTARPKDAAAQTGWVGRALDTSATADQADMPGVFLGQIQPPFSLRAQHTLVPTIQSLEPWLLAAPGRPNAGERLCTRLAQAARADTKDHPLLASVRQTTREACASTRRLLAVLEAKPGSGSKYPAFPLAQTLITVAQLMRAELGVRIYYAELGGGGIGGFDTHAGQAANHGALLRELSESVTAFLQDLGRDRLLDSVLVMTCSEFGRTLTENGRHGTDHGAAAPMLLAGGGVKGGLVGTHPSLTNLEEGALKHHTDFRRVYATALESWLGYQSATIFGGAFAPLEGVVKRG